MRALSEQASKGLAAYRKAEREHYNANDLAMMDFFHEDIVLTSNGVPTLRGRAAVTEFFSAVWAENSTRFIEVVDEQTTELGDLLLISGRFTLEVVPKNGGDTVVDNGRFQGALIRMDDGEYRLLRVACMDCEPET